MAEEEGAIPVKLKVHYTFDAEHKVDHLCRPSQSFHVQIADIEDNLTIGVIDLRSCLDAVTSSSPELTHFQDSDYTVYAYDYSEPNTPLVGQGMLSKVLSQEDNANEAMVTGKIMQNIMAKFKKNAEPFLEVRLRLTPITSSFQRARSGSMSSVTEGIHSQWSGFSSVGSAATERPQSPADMSRLDNVHRTLMEGGPRRDSSYCNGLPWNSISRPSSRPGTPTQSQQHPSLQPGSTHSRHTSQVVPYESQYQRRGSESGYWTGDEGFEEGPAKKRAKITQVQRATKDDFNIGHQPNSLRTAAMGASSLRIHQPTPLSPGAALQRGMPTEEPVRPPTPMSKARERKSTGRPRGRPPKNRTMESLEPSSPIQSSFAPHHQPISNMSSPEEVRDRPLLQHPASTPDMASSPPILTRAISPRLPPPRIELQNAGQNGNQDSGFFSAQGEIDAAFKDNEIFDDYPITADFDIDFSEFVTDSMVGLAKDSGQQTDVEGGENPYTPVFDDESTYEGPTPQPEVCQANTIDSSHRPESQKIPTPTLKQTSQPEQQNNRHKVFQRPSLPPQVAAPKLSNGTDKNGRPIPTLLPRPSPAPSPAPGPAPAFQRSQSVLPPVPASDPGYRQFQRANTWTPDMSDIIMSDAIMPTEGKARGRKKVGKEQTKARLESAIAQGNLPPYCHNCGAIDTPAWRRGYVRSFEQAAFPMDNYPTSLNQGEMCYKEVKETHSDGSVKSWKGWKIEKSGGPSDLGWEQINLCNPCGLWFHKTKVPRPAEKWQKKQPKEKRKRKRPPKPPKSRTQPKRSAAGHFACDGPGSDAQEPPSEDSSPADTTAEDGPDENNDALTVDGENDTDSQEPELPPMPKSMSAQLGRRTVMFADVHVRQVKSSPLARGPAAKPIDLDLTPNKPLRRVLFPSPGNNRQELRPAAPPKERTNEEDLPSFVRRSPRLNKLRDVFIDGRATPMISIDGTVETLDKENITPRPRNVFDDLADDLTGHDEDGMPPPPMTPTPKRRSERLLSKTPQTARNFSREFGVEVSANAQMSPKAPKTPGNRTPAVDIAGIFMDTITRSLDPENMTPHTRAMAAVFSDLATPTSKRTRTRTGFTPNGMTPGGKASLAFDFPDLPQLKGSSPISHGDIGNIFSELPTERLYSDIEASTDGPMPSSPPVNPISGWDDSIADMINVEQFDAPDWAWFENDEVNKADASKLRTPKKQATALLGVETPRGGLRRSPRRAGGNA